MILVILFVLFLLFISQYLYDVAVLLRIIEIYCDH